jgi:hypothetical protein
MTFRGPARRAHCRSRQPARTGTRWWAAAACVSALLLVGATQAQMDSQNRQTALDTIRRLALQGDLPRDPDPSNPPSLGIRLPPELLWIPVIGGTAVLLYYLSTLLPGLRFGSGTSWEEEAAAEAVHAGGSTDPVLAADELARQGRFGEAMHLMLLHALATLREALSESIAESLTSREVLRKSQLSDAGRAALREIVGRVERSHFGQYPASPDDYAACRGAFSGFIRALHPERAA